jgi:hypothetical protein
MSENNNNTSNDHQILAQVLADYGIERSALYSLLVFINAPDELKALFRILDNTQSVLRSVADILQVDDPDHPLMSRLPHWHKIINTIQNHQTDLLKKLPHLDAQPKTPDLPPLRKYFISNGLYVALWYRSDDQDMLFRQRELLAQIAVALETCRQITEESSNWRNASYTATKAARQLVTDASLLSTCQTLPQNSLSQPAYLNTLKARHNESHLNDISVLLTHAVRRRLINKKSNSNQQNQPETIIFSHTSLPPHTDPDREDARPTITHQYRFISIQGQELKEAAKSGCAPEEFTGRFTVDQTGYDSPDPLQSRTTRQHMMRIRNASKQQAMRNQRIPYRWEMLTRFEANEFIKAVINLSTRQEKNILNIPSCELAAFISAMFWLSRPASDICTMQTGPSVPESFLAYTIKSNAERRWQIPANLLNSYANLDSSELEQAYPVVKKISIQVHETVAHIMDSHALQIMHKKGSSTRPLFKSPLEEYEKSLAEFTKYINQTFYTRLTAGRISSFIFEALAEAPGSELTMAMCITGQQHQLGNTALHYTALPVNQLQKTYQNLSDELLSSPDRLESTHAKALAQTTFRVGSRICPTRETIQSLIANLKLSTSSQWEKIRTAPWRDPKKLATFHNRLSFYTYTMIAFATGFRAVRNPLTRISQIDKTTGFAVISDKDYDDQYNSRLVWLPAVCLEQLDLFHRHCRRIRNNLLDINPNLHRRLIEQDEFMVFLNEYLSKRVEISPGELRKRIYPRIPIGNGTYKLPPNANRHYLRTHLLLQNCPPDIINSFLGHWELGEEPWSGLSGLSPYDFRKQLERYLVPLMTEDGWQVIGGLE